MKTISMRSEGMTKFIVDTGSYSFFRAIIMSFTKGIGLVLLLLPYFLPFSLLLYQDIILFSSQGITFTRVHPPPHCLFSGLWKRYVLPRRLKTMAIQTEGCFPWIYPVSSV